MNQFSNTHLFIDCLTHHKVSKTGGSISLVTALTPNTVTMNSEHMLPQQVRPWRRVMKTYFLFSFLNLPSHLMRQLLHLVVGQIIMHQIALLLLNFPSHLKLKKNAKVLLKKVRDNGFQITVSVGILLWALHDGENIFFLVYQLTDLTD